MLFREVHENDTNRPYVLLHSIIENMNCYLDARHESEVCMYDNGFLPLGNWEWNQVDVNVKGL